MDYITAMESRCSKLKEEDTMELRSNINSLLRKAQVTKPNSTRGESIGLAQLKKDKDRVILTADKGVAMVVMDREEYVSKKQELLAHPAYRSPPRDPTNTSSPNSGKLKRTTVWMRVHIKLCILLVAFPKSVMGYLKSIKQTIPSGPLFLVGGQSLMGLQRSLARCLNPY